MDVILVHGPISYAIHTEDPARSRDESELPWRPAEGTWPSSGRIKDRCRLQGENNPAAAWGRPSGTWLCAKIRAARELPNQAPWAHSQAPVALGQAGLGIVPSVA
ncbi:hypothetical protein PGT21_030673 [Puccinia graminis f. sp. tritici]|uniref:Uncharacterized protein n=1 Tax=Puccinia graminis f. sp. tritici TaxID=56615 RepID=A0A5B0QJV8_PUCGR|nr:hypothetical protein PGT21_030673 [Puccinia graminis f. sp. tritici]